MTKFAGRIHKMAAKHAAPIEYHFSIEGVEPISVNQYLGQRLSLNFTGKISCIACNRQIKKTYQQGYCFPCAQSLAACDLCILKPSTCHFDNGTCRQPDWGLANCFIPHIVYLANSSGVKVGITRETQVPTRWIDQGAVQALPIFRVKSRYQAGLLEVAIGRLISDRTDWRKMLRGGNELINLAAIRDNIFAELSSEIQEIAGRFKFGNIEILTNEAVHSFEYPVLTYPQKISSLNLDKTPQINSVLQGIKGQYLILEAGVLNLRNFTGYELELAV